MIQLSAHAEEAGLSKNVKVGMTSACCLAEYVASRAHML